MELMSSSAELTAALVHCLVFWWKTKAADSVGSLVDDIKLNNNLTARGCDMEEEGI